MDDDGPGQGSRLKTSVPLNGDTVHSKSLKKIGQNHR